MKLREKIEKAEKKIQKRLHRLGAELMEEGFVLEGVKVSVKTHRIAGHPADAQLIDVTLHVVVNNP